MKIAWITTFPPKHCAHADRAYFLLQELLGVASGVEFYMLAQREPSPNDVSGACVIPCWPESSPGIFHPLVRTMERIKPQVMDFSFQFGHFGGRKIIPFIAPFFSYLNRKYGGKVVFSLLTHVRHFFNLKKILPHGAFKMVIDFFFKRADRIILFSHCFAKKFQEATGMDGDKVCFLPWGVKRFPKLDKEESKRRLGLEGKSVALTFGYMRPGKGYEDLVESFANVVKGNKNAILCMLGEAWSGAYVAFVKGLVRRLGIEGNVIIRDEFVPIDSELAGLYFNAADVAVIPYSEDVSISAALNSYVGYGLPVVSTDFSYAKENIEAGRFGLLVPRRSAKAMAEALTCLLTSQKTLSQLTLRAEEWADRNSYSNVASRLFEIYKDE